MTSTKSSYSAFETTWTSLISSLIPCLSAIRREQCVLIDLPKANLWSVMTIASLEKDIQGALLKNYPLCSHKRNCKHLLYHSRTQSLYSQSVKYELNWRWHSWKRRTFCHWKQGNTTGRNLCKWKNENGCVLSIIVSCGIFPSKCWTHFFPPSIYMWLSNHIFLQLLPRKFTQHLVGLSPFTEIVPESLWCIKMSLLVQILKPTSRPL